MDSIIHLLNNQGQGENNVISHRTYAKKIILSCSFFLLVTTPRLSTSSAMHPAAPPREKQQPKTGTSINNKLAHRLVFTSIKQGSRSHKRRCTVYESDYVPCEHQPLGIKKEITNLFVGRRESSKSSSSSTT